MNETLGTWNALPATAAAETVLPCNGSRTWAHALAARRPFPAPEPLFAAADDIWRTLDLPDWLEAFDSHPRLGEAHAAAATAQSLHWSAGEQNALSAEAATRRALGEGNRLYETRFGRIFLLCATGKTAAEVLALLERRLGNDPQTELREAAEQQRRITQLRLRKWLGLPAAGCDSV